MDSTRIPRRRIGQRETFEEKPHFRCENGFFEQIAHLNREGENVSKHSDLRNCWQKIMRNDKNNATLNKVQPKFSPVLSENVGKIMSMWNLGL